MIYPVSYDVNIDRRRHPVGGPTPLVSLTTIEIRDDSTEA